MNYPDIPLTARPWEGASKKTLRLSQEVEEPALRVVVVREVASPLQISPTLLMVSPTFDPIQRVWRQTGTCNALKCKVLNKIKIMIVHIILIFNPFN